MENSNKRLGKGLEQLFSNESLYSNPLNQLDEIVDSAKEEDIVELNIDDLRSNPYQPRHNFDEEKLQELADSIKEFGVLEPIIVKKSIKGYEIVAGERRTKACILAGIKTIPAIIKDFSDEEITQEELAKRLGKSRSHVTNMLGLLKLPANVKADVLSGLISMGHAKVLSKIENEETINDLVNRVKKDKLSVRELENLSSNPEIKKKNPVVRKVEDKKYDFVEDAMTDKIGNRVRIKNNKITIPFNSEKDLERILDILDIKVNVD